MPTIVGILTFMIRINFVLSRVELDNVDIVLILAIHHNMLMVAIFKNKICVNDIKHCKNR